MKLAPLTRKVNDRGAGCRVWDAVFFAPPLLAHVPLAARIASRMSNAVLPK